MNTRLSIRRPSLFAHAAVASLFSVLPLLSLSSVTLGCADVFGEQPVLAVDFGVRVFSDDGRAIPGAEIVSNAGTSKTNAEGRAALVARGHEGDRQPYVVKCPKEYQSPASPLLVSLRRDGDPAKRPVYEVVCVPVRRTVVVAVRIDNGPDLPVVYLGQQVARTDSSGAAHVLVSVAPGEPFRLLLDTSEPGRENLRPQNPSAELAVGEADDLLVFEQKMTLFVPKVAPKPQAPRPHGPKRI